MQLYDLWSNQEERIRDWKESGKCSEEELRQLKWSWERTAAKLCPKGKCLPLIVYESEEDIQLDFYDRPYLNSLVPTRNRDTELGMSGDKEEKGPHGIRPRYVPLQNTGRPGRAEGRGRTAQRLDAAGKSGDRIIKEKDSGCCPFLLIL